MLSFVGGNNLDAVYLLLKDTMKAYVCYRNTLF